jgi:hypothetical protein
VKIPQNGSIPESPQITELKQQKQQPTVALTDSQFLFEHMLQMKAEQAVMAQKLKRYKKKFKEYVVEDEEIEQPIQLEETREPFPEQAIPEPEPAPKPKLVTIGETGWRGLVKK